MEPSISPAGATAWRSDPDKRFDRLCILGLYIASLAPRLFAIVCPPTTFYYNFDERDTVMFSALDRFFGIPSVSIMEPATIVQLLSLPFYALDMLIRFGVPHHLAECLDKIAVYLSIATRDPRHVITITRVLVAFLCSLAPMFAYQIARRRLRASVAVAMACGLVVAIHPMFFFQSVMAAGDSVAATLVLLSVSVLMSDRWPDITRIGWSAVLFAAAVGSKITAASVIVLPLMLVLWEPLMPLSRRIRLAVLFGATSFVAFLAFVPFAWTDPLRFAKAVFGTINKSGGEFNFEALWNLFVEAHGIVLVFGVAIAVAVAIPIIVSRWPQQGRYAAASVITLLIMIVPVALHSTTAYSRYLVPAVPGIVILFAAIGGAIVTKRALNRLAVGVLAFMVVSMAWKEFQVQIRLRKGNDLVDALRATSSITGVTSTLIPSSGFELQIVEMPRSFWLRMARRAAEMEHGQGVRSFVEQHGISPRVADVLVTIFNEHEQSDSRHAAAAAMTAPNLPYDVFVYAEREGESTARQPQIDMSVEKAMSELRSEQNATAILVRQPDSSLGTPVWQGHAEWFWYVVGPR